MKLAICDIDNTLVVKHEPLSDYSRRMILELQKRGWLFGLASGRAVPQLKELAAQWGIHVDVFIGLNGCELYDGLNDEYKMYYSMEPEWVKEALDIMSPFDTVPCGSRGRLWISLNKDTTLEESKKYFKKEDEGRFILIENVEEFYSAPMDKICFRIPESDMPKVLEHTSKFKSEHYKTIQTEKTMLEYCNINASKGNMVKIFCDKHNIDHYDVWAFGDMSNDIDMLQMAGHGVCLLNGSDDAKAVSEYITEKPISEDGWAYFVEKHLL